MRGATGEAVTAQSGARSAAAVPVAGAVLLLLLAYDPAANNPSFTGRAAVLVVAGLAALPLLVVLARGGDRAAVAATAFVAWSGLSALWAGDPLAWAGQYGLGTGAIFVACLGGAWAAGRHLGGGAHRLVVGAVLAGALANAAVAVLQGPFDLTRYGVYLFDGRSAGLLGNPVFLGALCAAAAALLPPLARGRLVSAALAASLLGAGLQMAGSRIGLVLVVLALAAGVRQAGLRATAALLAAALVGVLSGTLLSTDRQEATNALARINAQPAAGLEVRLEGWTGGLAAALDQPVLGHGPGRYGPALGPHRTVELARAGSKGRFLDAHNVAVEYAATTGLVGVALLAGWVGLAFAAARAPDRRELLVAAAVLLISQLLQPQHVALSPIAFLLLGAAGAGPAPAKAPAAPVRLAMGVLSLLALLPAGALLVGDNALKAATLDRDTASARRAATLLRPWSLPLSTESRIHQVRYERGGGRTELVRALVHARGAARREPDDPARWIAVGVLYGLQNHPQAAADAAARALEEDPWSRLALLLRSEALRAAGRREPAGACRSLVAVIDDPEERVTRSARADCLGAA